MIGYTNVNEYISYLINNQVNVNIIDFVKEINKLKYNIDISFIDEFIELVSKDECCIHHNMLQKYGISNLKGGTSDINKLLIQNNFIETEDYQLRNVSELRPQGGTSIKNEYYLHPEAFKICLMRSKNTKIYAKYYILLEKCIKYFNDYQLEFNKKYIIKLKEKNKENKIIIKEKDDKIDNLENKINQILESNKNLEKLLTNTNNKLNTLKSQNNELLDSVEDFIDYYKKKILIFSFNDEIHHKLDISTEERVINPNNNQKLENFAGSKNHAGLYDLVIFRSRRKNIDFKYNVIRCRQKLCFCQYQLQRS